MFGVLRFSNLLFWAMALVGGLTLAPCLLLPPLLEFEGQRAVNAEAAARNADLRERLTAATKKVEGLRTDPSYRERVLFEDRGQLPAGTKLLDLRAPREMVSVAPPPASMPPPVPPLEAKLAEAGTEARGLLTRYPLARVFVEPQTRPVLMIMGGVLLLNAVVLLGQPVKKQG